MPALRPHPRSAASGLPRLLGLAGCLALLAACGDEPAADPAATPGAAAAPPAASSAPAAPAAPPSAAFDRAFTVDDPAIGSEVGERVAGVGLRATGRAGWLAFGPYAPVPRGRYVVELRGTVDAGHAGALHVDVADGKGSNVIAAVEAAPDALGDPASPGLLLALPFELVADSADLEVRVRASEASRVSVSGYRIRATP